MAKSAIPSFRCSILHRKKREKNIISSTCRISEMLNNHMKMKPAYFPFTYISRSTFDTITAVLGQVVIYQPSTENVPELLKDLESKGRLEIRIPLKAKEKGLHKLIREFQRFSDLHQTSVRNFLRYQRNRLDDSTPSRIRTEIRRRIRGNGMEEKADPLFNARLFLLLAQEFDIHKENLGSEIRAANHLEFAFLTDLRGEDTEQIPVNALADPENPSEVSPEAPIDYMIPERLRAWCRLALQDEKVPAILVTTNRSAYDRFVEKFPAAEIISNVDTVTIDRSPEVDTVDSPTGLIHYLERFVQGPRPQGQTPIGVLHRHNGSPAIRLTIGIIPHQSPRECLTQLSLRPSSPSKNKESQENTVLALIEFVR